MYLEDLDEAYNNLEKEAGIGSTLLKGTGKILNGTGNLAVKAGTFAVKHPFKAMTSAVLGAGAVGSVSAAKKEFAKQEPEEFANNRFVDKTAAFQERPETQEEALKKERDRKFYKALPYATTGMALGLGAAQFAKTKDIGAVRDTLKGSGAAATDQLFKKSIKDIKKKNKGLGLAIGIVEGGRKNIKNMIAGVDSKKALDEYRKFDPTAKGKTDAEIRDAAAKHFISKRNETIDKIVKNKDKDYMNNIVDNWSKSNKIKDANDKDIPFPGRNISPEKIQSILDDEVKRYAANRKFIKSDTLEKYLRSSTPDLETINKSIGVGAAVGVGDFAIHSLGDKYFDAKDNEEYKKILRDQYNLNGSKNKPYGKKPQGYITPKQKASRDARLPLEVSGLTKQASINSKFADLAPETQEHVKKVLNDDVKNQILKGFIYPVSMLGAIETSRAMGSSAFKKKKPEEMSNKTIIEIPIEEPVSKVAMEIPDAGEVLPQAGKLIGKPNLKKTLGDSGKFLLSAYIYNLISGEMRDKLDVSSNKLNDNYLGPVEPGKARVIIETAPKKTEKVAASNEDIKRLAKEILTTASVDKHIAEEDEDPVSVKLVSGVKKKGRMLK